MTKKDAILVDAGANVGDSFGYWLKWGWDINPDLGVCDFILIEPNKFCNPYLLEIERQWRKSCTPCQANRKVTILNKALQAHEKNTTLYGYDQDSLGNREVSITTEKDHNSGNIFTDGWIEKMTPLRETECIDVSKFLKSLSKNYKNIYMKLDIESAEYDVLEKMIEDETYTLVKEMWVEWHAQYMELKDWPKYSERMIKIENFFTQKNVNTHGCFGNAICQDGAGCANCVWAWNVPDEPMKDPRYKAFLKGQLLPTGNI